MHFSMPEFLSNPVTLGLVATLLVVVLLFDYLIRRIQHGTGTTSLKWSNRLKVVAAPVRFLAWYYGLYAILWFTVTDAIRARGDQIDTLFNQVFFAGWLIAILWFCTNIARLLEARPARKAGPSVNRFDDVVLPLIGQTLRVVLPIVLVFLFIRAQALGPNAELILRKLTAVALIAAVGWLLRSAILLFEDALLKGKETTVSADYQSRSLITRIRLLRKIAVITVTVVSFAAVLMLFEEVRDIGRSIIASAGVAGIIIGFAAQRSLGSLFAGLQIAFTQPIRIGDQVVVESEFGTVEEITLTYVVIATWDLRRLVFPISYFLEKPVQNWTRASANLLSPMTLRCDFSLPVTEFRNHMESVIKTCPFWDGKVYGVQVTDAFHDSMEIRILGSASNAGDSFNLRCFLREKGIEFIRENYPECLPRLRFNPPTDDQAQIDGQEKGVTAPMRRAV